MNKKRKLYLKLNLVSLFFAGVSFISITLAWFAYSGLASTSTEINVKAWHIEFTKNDRAVSNNIVISLTDISPGMKTVSETIKIKNMGDSDAALSYEITSARILDDTITSNGEEGYVEDVLAHKYPFHINMSLSDPYTNAHDGVGEFEVSVSWPLDADNDEKDSEWGNKAYNFNDSENEKKAADPNYQVRSSLKIEINLKAEQYIGDDASSPDLNYNLGDIVLYNLKDNVKCTDLSSTNCLKTYVIDKNNKMSDTSVTLLPDLYDTYTTGTASEYTTKLNELKSGWSVTSRALNVKDILSVVSKDVLNTVLIRPNMTNEIVGYLDYKDDYIDRAATHIKDKAIAYNGYYRFNNEDFPYFITSKCYWLGTEYNDTHFALKKIDDTYSKIYNESKNTECSIVPVIEVSKQILNES